MFPKTKRRHPVNKYRNKPVIIDGIKFPSIKEGNRYLVLKQQQKEGKIQLLKRQVTYKLIVNDILICKYRADFVYYDMDGTLIVEDAKGYRTPEYKLKRSLMKAVHGIDIKET